MTAKNSRFGPALRKFMSQLDLGRGVMGWFNEEVGLDDRYLRRWFKGDHLPSDVSWDAFVKALRKGRDQSAGFEKNLAKLNRQLALDRQRAVSKKSRTGPAEQSLSAALVLLGTAPTSEYLQWLAGVGASLNVNIHTIALTEEPTTSDLLIVFSCESSESESTLLAHWLGRYSGLGRPIVWLQGQQSGSSEYFKDRSLVCQIAFRTTDDLAPVVAVLDAARRLSRISRDVSAGGHLCLRRAVQVEQRVSSDNIVTTTELEIQSLVEPLARLHHGIVISDQSPEVNLTASTIRVSSLQRSHSLILDDVLPGVRMFQFAVRIKPPLTRGAIFKYQYVHGCPNYLPLSRKDALQRQLSGKYHLDQPICEKSYTITCPTQHLSLRIVLPKASPRVVNAWVEVATWKSDTPDDTETRRLNAQRALDWHRFKGQDEIVLTVENPRLFARYRIFWEYEE